MLHGALHLPSGNAAQLTVAQTGQRVPNWGVRECRGSAHKDDQRLDTNTNLILLFVFIITLTNVSLVLCHRSSDGHVWDTQPAVSGLVHPPESLLFLHRSQISF